MSSENSRATRQAPSNMPRRDFMKKSVALGVGLGLGHSLSAHANTPPSPKRGGRLRMGLAGGATSDSLDPLVINDVMPAIITRGQLRNLLIGIDHNLQLTPELATEWQASKDLKTWTIEIRKGVEFHNGKTLDAEDVKFSLNRHRGDDSGSGVKVLLTPVTDIRTDGPHRIVIELNQGNVDFPYVLTDRHFQILPAGTTDARNGVGTGGYQLVENEPGVRTLVKRFGNYWREGHAHFDEIETLGISDAAARMNALRTGAVDVINRPDLKAMHLIERLGNIQTLNVPSYAHYTMPMHVDVKPFDQLDVRLALKHAIDRKAMVDTVLRGYGIAGNDHPISPIHRYHADALPQREYDPERAKFHLKQAGLDKLKLALHASDGAFAGGIDAAVLYKESAAKAGIDIEVIREPADGYWSSVWLKKPWCECYWGGRITEDVMFTTGYAADAAWNDTHWKHEKFNQLLIAGRLETDPEIRRDIYTDMQQIVHQDGGAIVPMIPAQVTLMSDKLAFPPDSISGANELDGYRLCDRFWFA